jgi:hypothetical protein
MEKTLLDSKRIIGGAFLLFAGCAAAVTASADFDPATDFAVYTTYAWGPADEFPTGDPRLDSNPFFNKRVRSAVEQRLEEKGLQKVDSLSADLLLHYHAAVDERFNVYTADRVYGIAPPYGYEDQVVVYEEGTLVLDMVDRATSTVVWRGWTQTNIEGLLDDPARLEERIDEGVEMMFQKFPLTSTGVVTTPGS